jgi:hypothetical protein
LKIETKHNDGSSEVTFILSDSTPGVLNRQIKSLVIPTDSRLSNVKVFSSMDGQLALNIFYFESTKGAKEVATRNDAKQVYEFAEDLRTGKIQADPVNNVPAYHEFFSEKALDEYFQRITPSYVLAVCDPRRFLLQRIMFEKVRSTESVDVHIEHSMTPGVNGSWLTIAAANVLPEVLLSLSSAIITAGGLDIYTAFLDTVNDAENEIGPDMPGYVTTLRLLVSDVSFLLPIVMAIN